MNLELPWCDLCELASQRSFEVHRAISEEPRAGCLRAALALLTGHEAPGRISALDAAAELKSAEFYNEVRREITDYYRQV